jgi:iron complex transport system substrate-binding protein
MTRPLLALLLAAALLGGCGAAVADPAAEDGSAAAPAQAASGPEPEPTVPVVSPAPRPALPATVTGADGRTVTVTDASRVVALQGPIAETVVALGLADALVGRDQSTTLDELADLPVVSTGHSVSAEGVLSLAPTLVLADARTGPAEVMDQLRAAGVPVVVVPEVWTLEEMDDRVRAIAAALGVADAGEELAARLTSSVTAAPDGDGPRVAFLYLRGTAAVYLLGGDGSGADSLIEAAGGVDAGSASGLGSFTPLTSEALAAAAPEVLLVMSKGLDSVGGVDGLLELPGVAQTPAGRDRRVVVVEDGLLLAFGPRTPYVLDVIRQGIG